MKKTISRLQLTRYKEVRLTNNNVGIVNPYTALEIFNVGDDIILLSDGGKTGIPVIKFGNLKKEKYQQKKIQKPQTKVENKTIRLTLNMSSNDLTHRKNTVLKWCKPNKKFNVLIELRLKSRYRSNEFRHGHDNAPIVILTFIKDLMDGNPSIKMIDNVSKNGIKYLAKIKNY